MAKPINKRANGRFKKMIVLTSMTAVLLAVSTYAWFVGMQTVNVSPFDVEIAAIDGLALSLNGVDFSTTVNINSENFDDAVNTVYATHTNTWGQGGLSPVSSVGDIDDTVSRLKLYEKSSLTANAGGYRLMASRVPNNVVGEGEHRGYVAFDLFVKNLSGTDYIEAFDINNEENIYLTTDSAVKTALGGVQNTGIENSVRVAFAQIGRVKSDALPALVQGITCTAAAGIVPICTRPATIWEPNDTRHVAGAINYYDESCQGRTVVTGEDAFAGACTAVADLGYTTTYAIQAEITDSKAVNVYDGLNGYNDTIGTRGEAGKPLMAVTSFTDTDKVKTGVERPEFLKLAANSITKVRVYIYLEGQDVDNYDYASVGKKIAVNFGFTKQRFTEGEIVDVANDGTTIAPAFTVPVTANPLTIAVADVATFNVNKVVTLQYAKLDAGKYVITNEGYLEGEDTANPTRADLNGTVVVTLDGAAYDSADLLVGEHRITYSFTDDRGYSASTTITVIVE